MHKATRNYLVFLFSGILVLLLLTTFGYYFLHPITQQRIPVDVIVGDYTGINLDNDALHFGTIKPGSSVQRPIHLSADQYAVEITLFVEGIPFIYPAQPHITLQKGEEATVSVFAVTDVLTPKQRYEGVLVILTKKL